jgi:ATP synthase protein I
MDQNAKQGIQAGIEMVVTIGACTAAGYGLDKWLETKPAFLLVMFFLGVCTAFYNVYRLTSKSD